ncbi:MAG: hypothetical protein ACLP2P_04175 [Desulfobaccales bacterium]
MNNFKENERLNVALKLYNDIRQDIAFCKGLQFKITYYTFAIIAGIDYLSRDITLNEYAFIIRFILYFLISYLSYKFIWKIEGDLRKNRKYIEAMKDKCPIIRILLNEQDIDKNEILSQRYKIEYPRLYSCLVFGCSGIFWIFSLMRN